ncbi:DUF2497 domain-containing protein [Vineibacter terrae]|uniref:DUF2497 domain-containing protein n=1 Tax=Vineibacter terrae TaxID=2586908 RepID=UPI002E33B754|nr:DUF2497 domain-containing protein [Vineibacter terrae]HEX2886240.1 DUF2497 domain-containing protein [Vineibacter terrae]
MNDSKAHRDPSMDDILSSIRRIIHEDAGRAAAAAKAQAATPSSGAPGPAASSAAATAGAARPNGKPGRHDDVLLLTDLIEAPDPGGAPAPAAGAGPMASNPISSAMDRLARAVEEARPPVAPAAVSAGGRSMEDVVQEMLRPLLREWLEKNLPPMVERIVEREVQRLTQR